MVLNLTVAEIIEQYFIVLLNIVLSIILDTKSHCLWNVLSVLFSCNAQLSETYDDVTVYCWHRSSVWLASGEMVMEYV